MREMTKAGSRKPRKKDGMNAKQKFSRNTKTPSNNMEKLEGKESTSDKFGNDFSWYDKNPYLTESVGRVPFPYRPGMRFTQSYSLAADGTVGSSWASSIPGVMAITWLPSFQDAGAPTDPNGLVAKEMYARIRKAFSGTLPEDAPDIVVYMYAIDSIYAYITSLKRIYRAITAWNPNNFVVPDALLNALGVYPTMKQQLLQRKTEFWGMINQLIDMTKRFNVPKVWDLFKRHQWMNETVFSDAATPNSQLYVFRQQGFFQWSLQPTGSAGINAGGLKIVYPSWYMNTDASPDYLQLAFNFGQQLIDALADGDSDNYTISGHIARAFENFEFESIDYLQQDETIEIAYSEEVLSQIENAQTIGLLSASVTSNITVQQRPANNSFVGFNSITVASSAVNGGINAGVIAAPIINSRYDRPEISDVITSTRLKSQIISVTKNTTANTVTIQFTAGSEIPLVFELHYVNASGDAAYVNIHDVFVLATIAASANPSYAFGTLSQFDWHPILRIIRKSGDAVAEVVPYGDIHNITTLSINQLMQMHRVCLLSELNAFGIEA